MGNVYDAIYAKALEGKPENAWVVSIHGKPGDKEVEVALVHTSYPHGLISYGWGGSHKLVLLDGNEGDLPRKGRLRIHKAFIETAEEMLPILNKNFPEGLFE